MMINDTGCIKDLHDQLMGDTVRSGNVWCRPRIRTRPLVGSNNWLGLVGLKTWTRGQSMSAIYCYNIHSVSWSSDFRLTIHGTLTRRHVFDPGARFTGQTSEFDKLDTIRQLVTAVEHCGPSTEYRLETVSEYIHMQRWVTVPIASVQRLGELLIGHRSW